MNSAENFLSLGRVEEVIVRAIDMDYEIELASTFCLGLHRDCLDLGEGCLPFDVEVLIDDHELAGCEKQTLL